MSGLTILGLSGDILTFVGGLVLSIDALRRASEFKRTTDLQKTVAALAGINLTQKGLYIFDDKSVELVFIRQSVRRAFWGIAIITSGFLCILATKIVESLAGRP
jgi:hypothetical protein